MRKLFLSVMAVAALTSQAVTPNQVIEYDDSYFKVIPTFVAHNGVPTLYFGSKKEGDETVVYKLYTESFEEKGSVTFNVNMGRDMVKYQFYRPLPTEIYTYYNDYWSDASSLDEAKRILSNHGWNTHNILQADGGLYFFFQTDDTQPAELSALTERPDIDNYLSEHLYCYEYFVYTQPASQIERIVFSYSETVYNRYYSDELVEAVTHDYGRGGYICSLDHFDSTEYNYSNTLYLTQTLFNDNADYEALIPVYKETETSEQTTFDGYFEGMYLNDVPATKITVSSEITEIKAVKGNTGEVVTTFELPNEISATDVDAYLFTTSTGKYLCIYTDEHLLVYDLSSGESGSVKSPMLIEAVKVRPSVVKQGEEISVEAGDNTEIESVTITDMRGATRRIAPNAGKRRASINSGRLAKGMHIVGVETADGTQSSKVIVR